LKPILVVTPFGKELVLPARSDFEAMRDAWDAAAHGSTMAQVARGEQEMRHRKRLSPRSMRRRRSPSGAASAA
jgi:hypothetical protein